MRTVVIRYAESEAETIMLNSVNTAVLDVLTDNSVTYGDIVNLSNNPEGYVTCLEINVKEINRLKGLISNKTADLVIKGERYTVSVPLGAFLGTTYTSGMGPRIKFKMQMTCTAVVGFSHEFKSAGINQVLHIINVDTDIKGSLLTLGYNKSVKVSSSAIAAQTVIVGSVPEAFTNVIESENDNTAGLINDYGALAE